MRTIRRVGGVAFAGALLTAVVGGPAASAQTETKTPETYVGSAAGRALNLSIAGRGLTAGASSVNIDSTLKAVAQGTGLLSPLGAQQTAKLEQIGEGTKNAAETCALSSDALPAPVKTLVGLGIGCSSALAAVENGLPKATATGKIVGLDVDLSVLTKAAGVNVGTLAPILDPVLGGVGQLEGVLESALARGGQTVDVGLEDTLSEVITALVQTKTLEVDLGPSVSQTITDGSKVTSIARAEAGVIKLFPVGAALQTATGIEMKPIVEIIIGSAEASATYDRATGKSVPKFDPAIVTIKVNTPLTNALGEVTGFDLSEIVINPNLVPSQLAPLNPVLGAVVKACSDAPNEFCVLEGTPLETRIAIASGRTVTNPDGSVGAIADAVKVHALKNIASLPGGVGAPLAGGILLELAHAEAGVGGAPAQIITVPTPEIPRELPRTGGTPVLPMVAVAGVGIALAARRTLARVTAR